MIIPRNFQYLVLNEATKNRTKLNRTNEGKKIELNLRICSVVVFTADRSFIDWIIYRVLHCTDRNRISVAVAAAAVFLLFWNTLRNKTKWDEIVTELNLPDSTHEIIIMNTLAHTKETHDDPQYKWQQRNAAASFHSVCWCVCVFAIAKKKQQQQTTPNLNVITQTVWKKVIKQMQFFEFTAIVYTNTRGQQKTPRFKLKLEVNTAALSTLAHTHIGSIA